MRLTIILILLSSLIVPGAAWAVSPKAAKDVKQGIEQFAAGDYAAAAESFGSAANAEPDDSRIAFDQACAHAAAGNEANAVHLFQKAALAEDTKLAARCHYNMGCIDVDKAKNLLAGKVENAVPEEEADDPAANEPAADAADDAAPKETSPKETIPEEAAPQVRQEAIQLLEMAIAHFRDATELDPEDPDARHNIEASRLWIDYIQEVWRQRDAQQAREKAELLGYLKTIDQRQRVLRLASKGLSKARKSPKQRQGVFHTARAQGYLSEEVDPLKLKIQAAVRKPPAVRPGQPGHPGQPGQPGQPMMPGAAGAAAPGGCPPGCQPGSPGCASNPGCASQPGMPGCGTGGCGQPQVAAQADPEKAMQVLGGLADNAGTAMAAAQEELDAGAPQSAVAIQAEAVEKLDEIYMVLAPYVTLVKSAIDKQQGLVTQSAQAVANEKAGKEPVKADPPKDDAEEKTAEQDQPVHPPVAERPPVDLEESVWEQPFITRYSEVIRAKAQQGLKNMPPPPKKEEKAEEEEDDKLAAAPATVSPTPPAAPGTPPAAAGPPKKMDPAEAMKKQQEAAQKKQEAMRKAMENAVKYCPKVRTLTIEATNHIEDDQPDLALPKQEEALELLKKMLPEDENKQQQQQQQQQQQNQDQKDQDKDKDKKDKDKKDQDKKDQDKKDQDKKDQDKKDKKDKQDQKDQKKDKQDQKKEKQQAKPKDLKKQQAEAVLRKARQREQEKRKMEKAMQIYLYRPGEVEKDW